MAFYTVIASPLGMLRLTSNGVALTSLTFPDQNHAEILQAFWFHEPSLNIFIETKIQLEEYFNGLRKIFNIPIVLSGTKFQMDVWNLLREIPFGETVSYKDIATRIDKPNSIRAVGQANGRNPISVIIPCHRIIGTNGSLTGYGGGIHRKGLLLNFEKKVRLTGPHKLADMPAYAPSLRRQS